MRRPALVLAGVTLAVIGLTTTRVTATAVDDQAAADTAIASFNERMTEAGGVSDGPPDMSATADTEIVEDDPFAECFGDIAALEPAGQLDGETARAFSDNFTFPPAGETLDTDALSMAISGNDTVNAAVITVDADHAGTIDELVRAFGSDEAETCLEGLFDEFAEDTDDGGASDNSSDDVTGFGIDVAAEPDLGIGDASASLQLMLSGNIDEEAYESNTAVYVARVDRSLVFLTINTDAEPTTDIDGLAELALIADSL